MNKLVPRIGIGALAVLFGILLFESLGLIAGTQVAQNSPPAARAPRPPAAAAEDKPPQTEPPARSAQAQPAPPQPAPPQPQQEAPAAKIPIRTEIQRFDGWIVTCNEFEGGPKTRVCSALLRILQQKTNQAVFSWTVELDNKKQMVAIMQTPTGVAIAPGVELRIGKSPARKIPFAACDSGRCVATTPVDANLLREMATSPTAQAVIQGEQGNSVEFNIEMKGFDKAYALLSRP